jgi:hypothetical protein
VPSARGIEVGAAGALDEQVARLVGLGLPTVAGVTAAEVRDLAAGLKGGPPGATLVAHPTLAPPTALAGMLSRAGRPGFVVEDMTDLDAFAPLAGLDVPAARLYLVHDVDRGDDLRGRTPDEVYPELAARGRTPLTISEGISWLLQRPEMLEPNACFMCLGSRRPRGTGLDARTPAIWISGGTGRDGRARRGAPKVGWCWAGNRHSWLGFAHAARRTAG